MVSKISEELKFQEEKPFGWTRQLEYMLIDFSLEKKGMESPNIKQVNLR